MYTDTRAALPSARAIMAARRAFNAFDADDGDPASIATLTECIEYFDERSGSLKELKECGLASALMTVCQVGENDVLREAARISNLFEKMTIDDLTEDEAVLIGRVLDHWAASAS